MPDAHRPVILLAYYFPPLAGIASERMAAYARHLPNYGWAPTVIAPESGMYHRSADASAPPGASVVRTRTFEISRFLRGAAAVGGAGSADEGSELRPIAVGAVGTWLRRLVHQILYVPDAQLGWVPFAVAAGRGVFERRLGPGRPVLFSSSVPFSAHLAAAWLAHSLRLPWVAEFRDPWTELPAALARHPAWRCAINARIQDSLLRRANRVVVTSEANRERLGAAFPHVARRIRVVMNGFEPGPVGVPPAPDRPMVFVYAGTVAPGESMAPFLGALDLLHAKAPRSFELHVYGPAATWTGYGRGERPWLKPMGVVPSQDARQAMTSASVNVMVNVHPAYRTVLPGKLFEYLGARRPVLAAVVPGSEMEVLLRRHGDARIVKEYAPAAYADVFDALLQEHRAGTLQSPRSSAEALTPLSRDYQTSKLADVFDNLAGIGGDESWR